MSLGYQVDLIDAAKSIVHLKDQLKELYSEVDKINVKISENSTVVRTGRSETKCIIDPFSKLPECHEIPSYYNPNSKRLSEYESALKRTQQKIEQTKQEITMSLGKYPELLLDRQTGFWSKDEIWEEQPWISRVSKMIPGSDKVKHFLKDSKTTMEDNVIKTINSLCMVPSLQVKTQYDKDRTVYYTDTKEALPYEYSQCHLRLSAETPKRSEKIKLLEKLLIEKRENDNPVIETRITRLCDEETPYTMNQLLNFQSARESVLEDFQRPYLNFAVINSCSQKSKESEEFYHKWSALGVGMGCLLGSVALGFSGVGAPLIGVLGAACSGIDLAIAVDNFNYYEDNFLKVSRCANAQIQSCDMSSYEQAIESYNSSINDIYYASGGAVLGEIVLPFTFSKIGQLRKIKELSKYVAENLPHLPSDVAQVFNEELSRINKLKGKEKIEALSALRDDLEEIRSLQKSLSKQGRNISEVLSSCPIK